MSQDVELAQVLAQARDIARLSEQTLSSAHVLLAMFTVPNAAELLLLERQISEETVLQAFDAATGEPPGTLDRLASRADQLAEGFDAAAPTCLHWLAACTKEPTSYAYRLLEAAGVSMPRLRGAALRFATHGVPAHLAALRHAV
ncbi:MAG: ATP-dependent Clp protease ATP-binding subunit, partial [Myxococcales bacterium]|nr:ATP-dependent Clp protease ATP-binding subunit [Myxococcales bacterium]